MAEAEKVKDAATKFSNAEFTDYIRWFFTGFVLSFVSIILSGKLLTQLPVFRLNLVRGNSTMRFPTFFINLSAVGDEVIIGIGGFISVLFLTAIIGGGEVPKILLSRFGLELAHFESLCIFSSFLLLISSFIAKILYSAFSRSIGNYPPEYAKQIENLSKEDQG